MTTLFNRRNIALAIGVFYSTIGLLGFVPGVALASGQPDQSLLFGLLGTSVLLNLVHLAIGLIALWASQQPASCRSTLTGLGAAFALLTGAAFVAPFAGPL